MVIGKNHVKDYNFLFSLGEVENEHLQIQV